MTQRLATSSGVEIAFDQREGATGAPTVVLLHGLTSSRESYGNVVEHLAPRYHVLNVDLRGHGESDHAPRYRAVDYAADVVELIAKHASVDRTVVAGHSLGGLTAAALVANHPGLVAGVLLEDPPIFEGDPAVRAGSAAAGVFPALVAELRRMRAARATLDDYERFVGDRPTPFGVPLRDRALPDDVRASARAMSRVDPATVDAAISSDTWSGFDPDAALTGPVTVLQADPSCGAVFLPDQAVRFKRAVPQANVVLMDGLSHGIHTDRYGIDRYLEQLDTFLDTVFGDG